jgi:hypothetical protein
MQTSARTAAERGASCPRDSGQTPSCGRVAWFGCGAIGVAEVEADRIPQAYLLEPDQNATSYSSLVTKYVLGLLVDEIRWTVCGSKKVSIVSAGQPK